MVRHPDFEKIHAAFLQHYSKNLQLGEERYSGWVKDSNLDETQSYYLQGAQRAGGIKQNFDWAKFLLQFVKEDKDAYYYKVEALFPVESMNKDTPPFTRDEVLQAARSLTGKPSDLNHDHTKMLEGVEVTAAQFEDDCVECVCRVPKTSSLVGMIQRKEIVSVSIEGEWSHGIPGQGLVLTGLGWLTKQTMLPGIPLTRIMPVEQIAESFKPQLQNEKWLKSVPASVVAARLIILSLPAKIATENSPLAVPRSFWRQQLPIHFHVFFAVNLGNTSLRLVVHVGIMRKRQLLKPQVING